MTRRRGLAAIAGLVGLGMLAAGLAGALPESVRALAALALLLVLPVGLFEPLLRVRTASGADPAPLRISLAFLSWLSLLALWTAAFTLAGTSFRAYALATAWLLMALFGVVAVRSFVRSRAAAPVPAIARRWVILITVCAVFAAVIPHDLTIGEDGLDHVGYIRRIATVDTLRPPGVLAPRVEEPAPSWPDPRKGALHPVLSLVALTAAADPATVWRWLPVFFFPAVVLGAIAFNTAFLTSGGARWLAALILLLSFHGNVFRFAGVSTHGETLAAMFGWALGAAAVANRSRPWLAWTALAAGGVLVHLGVALHVFVLAATVACFGGVWGMVRRDRVHVPAALVTGAAFALLLRYRDLAGPVNTIHSHIQGVLFLSERWFVASPVEILRLNGMLFLGGLALIPVLLMAARSRREPRAMLAFAAIPCVLSFVPWVATALFERGSYMAFRSLLNVPVFAAIAFAAGWWAGGVERRERWAMWLGIPLATVWLLVFFRPVPRAILHDVSARVAPQHEHEYPARDASLLQMLAALPSGSVILTDPATSYIASAYTPHRFVATYQQHGNPRDPLALDRLEAVRDVLSPYAAPDAAVSACRRYGVDYVVVNGAPPEDVSNFLSVWGGERYAEALRRLSSMQSSFALAGSTEGAHAYRFERTAPVNRAWAPQGQPVDVSEPSLAPCEIDAPDDVFRITGISVLPSRALPGDTVRVTLGYRRDLPSPFALPMLMHVRFDHEPAQVTREFPGEKLLRRRADRRSGLSSRFRADLRPGHGVYEPDIWPTGLPLSETFDVVIPANARLGQYRIEVSITQDSLLPNFHLRDFLFNRDHYSGTACALLVIDNRTTVGDS